MNAGSGRNLSVKAAWGRLDHGKASAVEPTVRYEGFTKAACFSRFCRWNMAGASFASPTLPREIGSVQGLDRGRSRRIIQLMPNWSCTWAKRDAKKVSSIGMKTLPPLERAA